MRGSTIMMGTLVALLLCAIPASTQTLTHWTSRAIEKDFAAIETRRMQGNCADRDRRLANLNMMLAQALDPAREIFSKRIQEEYRTRLAEAAARRCPAGPLPAAPPASVPLPRTMTVDAIAKEFAGACGAAFEPARHRLIAALDRSIYIERNAGRRTALENDRARVIASPYRPCTVQPANAAVPWNEVNNLVREIGGACGDTWSVLRLRLLAALDRAIAVENEVVTRGALIDTRAAFLRRDPPPCEKPVAASGLDRLRRMNAWQAAATNFDTELLAAERARFAGLCTERTRRIGLARAALERIRSAGYTPPTPANHAARLTEQLGLRCTPKREASTAAASPLGKVATCRSIDQKQVRSGRPLTCSCARVEPYLSTWGSNPYRADSAICNAAVHAGVLPPNGVGVVRLVSVPQAETALGTSRNGINSSNWDYDTANGFTFSAGGSVTE